jgi:hypothetical protein
VYVRIFGGGLLDSYSAVLVLLELPWPLPWTSATILTMADVIVDLELDATMIFDRDVCAAIRVLDWLPISLDPRSHCAVPN